MISLKKDFKHGTVSLRVTQNDDLWYLSQIIAPNDAITMKTERKIKIGSDDGNVRIVRKTIVLTLQAESIDFGDGVLRVKGTVLLGPEDVAKGSYHSFGIGLDDSFTLKKTLWPQYLIERLNDALNNSAESVLFVNFDRESAIFSLLRQTGIEHLASIKVEVARKDYVVAHTASIYDEIIQKLNEYVNQHKPKGIVGACPPFWKEYLEKKLPAELKKKFVFTQTSEVSKQSVQHLLSRPEIHKLLEGQRLVGEQEFIDELLKHLDKEEVSYGLEDVKRDANSGAIKSIGVTDLFLKKSREEGFYDVIEDILKQVDQAKGKINFLSATETVKVLDGLGGIAGILRWKTT